MTSKSKIKQLQKIITDNLYPLIDHDYWLLDVPYYFNVGDTLIWQGALDFLSSLPYKCKGFRPFNHFDIPKDIKDDDIIIFNGGGNFGDLWSEPHDYKMQVVKRYPNSKIIFLPQTVFWNKKENMLKCANSLKKSPNITICARDKHSYDILSANFSNKILLIPDMAFCIDMNKWHIPEAKYEDLLLMRNDRELKESESLEIIKTQTGINITDWKPFTEESWQKKWLRRTRKYMPLIYHWYAKNIFRPYMIKSGIKLIGQYKRIYSTRLHAIILSILLGRESDMYWFDNSYGKNKNFYDTWLNDVDGLTFIN